MTILQHYYTSCEGKGFQTNAMSKNLDKETARVLGEKGVYMPPVSLPSQPTQDEMQKFPISLSFFSLPNNRRVVMQSVYLGKDYSGRYGNYFSHSLVSENYEKDFPSLLPIQLWKSPVWVSKETPQVDLPPFEEIVSDSFITWNDLFNFLKEGKRTSKLGLMITNILDRSKSRRPVIIVDTNQNIALWIAAITFSLPYDIAKGVTFSTYNKNPYSLDVMICGTTSDSDFHFSQQEYDFQYTIFQFGENRFSPDKPIHPYATIIMDAYKNKDAKAFQEFSSFYKEILNEVPESALELYSIHLLNSVMNWNTLSEKDWMDLLSFLLSYNFIDRNPLAVKNVIDNLNQTHFHGINLVLRILDLYQAVVHKGIPSDLSQIASKAALQQVFSVWPHANEGEITRIRAKLPGMDFTPLRGSYAPMGIKLIHTMSYEQQRSLLEFLIDIKFILSGSPELGTIMDTIVLPHIVEKDTQLFFIKLMKTEFRDPALNALGRYIANRQDDEFLLSAILPLITEDHIRSGLITFAIKNNHFPLYRLLYKLRITSGKEKFDQFLVYYSDLSKFTIPSKISELNMAYSITWKDTDPTLPEVIRIIETLDQDDLDLCDFSEKLAEVLLKNMNVMNIPDTVRPAFEKIQKSTTLSDVQKSLLSLFADLRNFSDENEAFFDKIYMEALSPSLNKYPEKREEILEYFFQRVITTDKHPSLHQRYIKTLVEVHGNDTPVHNAYRKAFTNALGNSKNPAKLFADAFRIWDQYYSMGKIPPGTITDFLNTAYKDAINDMDRRKMGMSEKTGDLLGDPVLKQKFESYREKTGEKGFSSLFKGIFGKKK